VQPFRNHAFGSGVMEEEELEEEDLDLPAYSNAVDEEDYEDIEEETLAAAEEMPGGARAHHGEPPVPTPSTEGNGDYNVTDAVREAHVEERAEDEEFDDTNGDVDASDEDDANSETFADDGEDFEEEIAAVGDVEISGDAQAEVRGPSGAAPRLAPERD